jgi:serine/threonine protein kinase
MSEPTRPYPPDADSATLTRAADAIASADAGDFAAPPGYELLGEIGRGGMGVVFRARDLDLGREVAVKILLPHYAPDSVTARRFVDEARITGRLQHPGIPAVYRVGTLADGRPFLAMKLIGGRTLEEMLKERGGPAAESGPFATNLERVAHGLLDRLEAVLDRGRFLAVFEQVAQAVAYAHQEGVIHRDLKPSNVMVSKFAEVQVMDWGIARSGDRRPESGGSTGAPAATVEYSPHAGPHTPQSDLTQAGAVLGTPAYMPPEQAIGAVDQIGKPSDVFGLGAILCVILTGKPPYDGADAESNRLLAARAKLGDAFARLDACGAEPELVALAKRCLAAEPADRPRDAGEVADAVAALRADAERRARQAEMDRARAEVKAAEEHKRRRVKQALALSVLGLVAVSGFAAWWADSVRAQRRADQQAEQLKQVAAAHERVAEFKARQLATERDVAAALNEAQVLREEGWKQADDPARWALTLTAARSALKRAEGLLEAGEPTDELRHKVAAATADLARDDRDRALIAELDRIGEENDIRFMLPVAISSGPSARYAAAFRAHGIDLENLPRDEAVAWLKGHRFKDRLTTAVRNWQLAQSSFITMSSGVDITLVEPLMASAAVAGHAAVASVYHRPTLRDRLGAILDAVVTDPFAREWWDAVARRDNAALKQLLARPEFARMSSRELAALADGLADYRVGNFQPGSQEVMTDFLRAAYERFPGEFWVNFRLAVQYEKAEGIRYMTAAVAARPRSAIARVMLGAALWERGKDDPTGPRMVRAAVDLDPASAWPHVFLAMVALDRGSWPDAAAAFRGAVRADPDTASFMMYALLPGVQPLPVPGAKGPPAGELPAFFGELIAVRPDHPCGYDLRAEYLYNVTGDYRAALADYRAAKALMRPDYPRRPLVVLQLYTLERLAGWGEKLPAVLGGELKPATSDEYTELARYCAGFEKRYALAARFAGEAMAHPKFYPEWTKVTQFAGWAVQAGLGKGADAADLTPDERSRLRRQALAWLRGISKTSPKPSATILGSLILKNPDLAPTRDPAELAKLPPDERAEWEKFWSDVRPAAPKPKTSPREVAPPPRPVKM